MSRSGGGRTGRRRSGGREASWVPKRAAADSPQTALDTPGNVRSARQQRRADEAAARRKQRKGR